MPEITQELHAKLQRLQNGFHRDLPVIIGKLAVDHFMEHFDIVNKVYVALEGFSGENFNGLNRRQVTRNKKVAQTPTPALYLHPSA